MVKGAGLRIKNLEWRYQTMSNAVTLEDVEQLATQLPPPERLKL